MYLCLVLFLPATQQSKEHTLAQNLLRSRAEVPLLFLYVYSVYLCEGVKFFIQNYYFFFYLFFLN